MTQQRTMLSMRSPLLGCRPRGIAAFSSPQHSRSGRRQAAVRASLDPQAALAVTQQGVAFAAVVGAEAAYIGLSTPATEKGRPVVTTTVGGVGAVVVVRTGCKLSLCTVICACLVACKDAELSSQSAVHLCVCLAGHRAAGAGLAAGLHRFWPWVCCVGLPHGLLPAARQGDRCEGKLWQCWLTDLP